MKRVRTIFLTLSLIAVVPTLALAQSGGGMGGGKPPVAKAWEILRDGLGDRKQAKRAAATEALGLVPNNKESLALAERGLEDRGPEVRTAAAMALGEMGAHESIPKLQEAMDDNVAAVVLAAAHSLQALGDPAGYDVYYTVLTGQRKVGGNGLKEQAKSFRNPKNAAIFAAGIVVPFAGLGYYEFNTLRTDYSSPVRAEAAQALAKDPDPRTAEALTQAVFDKKWVVRVAALNAIAERNDPALLAKITDALSDGNDTVRFTAAATVIRLSSVQANAPHSNEERTAAMR